MPPTIPRARRSTSAAACELIALLRDSWTTWRFEAERFIEPAGM